MAKSSLKADLQPSWYWFLFNLGLVWIVMNLDYLEDGFDLLILITSGLVSILLLILG